MKFNEVNDLQQGQPVEFKPPGLFTPGTQSDGIE